MLGITTFNDELSKLTELDFGADGVLRLACPNKETALNFIAP